MGRLLTFGCLGLLNVVALLIVIGVLAASAFRTDTRAAGRPGLVQLAPTQEEAGETAAAVLGATATLVPATPTQLARTEEGEEGAGAGAPTPALLSRPTAARSPEHTLALRHFGRGLQLDDERVRQLGRLLDELEARCAEDRARLADLAAGADRIMTSRGLGEPPLEILSKVYEAVPPGEEQPCADQFATYTLTRTRDAGASAAAQPPPTPASRPTVSAAAAPAPAQVPVAQAPAPAPADGFKGSVAPGPTRAPAPPAQVPQQAPPPAATGFKGADEPGPAPPTPAAETAPSPGPPNCARFRSQLEAQTYLRGNSSDPLGLDPDQDGIACESNPRPYDNVRVPR